MKNLINKVAKSYKPVAFGTLLGMLFSCVYFGLCIYIEQQQDPSMADFIFPDESTTLGDTIVLYTVDTDEAGDIHRFDFFFDKEGDSVSTLRLSEAAADETSIVVSAPNGDEIEIKREQREYCKGCMILIYRPKK